MIYERGPFYDGHVSEAGMISLMLGAMGWSIVWFHVGLQGIAAASPAPLGLCDDGADHDADADAKNKKYDNKIINDLDI